MSCLRVIFGDQLNHKISSLKNIDKKNDLILMAEVKQEFTYVKHHKKKIVFIISAMRHFAHELQSKGFNIHYIKLNDSKNSGNIKAEVKKTLEKYNIKKVIVTMPCDYRLYSEIKEWQDEWDTPIELCDDDRFLCSIENFKSWAKGHKQLKMEYFYREMRKQHEVLMVKNKPVGGQWNYDSENRKVPKTSIEIPSPYQAQLDTTTKEIIDLVEQEFTDHFGDIEPFQYAVTREQALRALDNFITKRLAKFGDYQDAMLQDEPWMFHSHLSLYLNCGLLLPQECIDKVEQAYHEGQVPLNAAEGYIRQILGWREFVRGVYWSQMPKYESLNYLNAKNKLPEFFWGSETKMNCMRQAISETKQHAYAHHIQRLMVLGNYALLTGIDPKFVNEWYLIVYADAYQWVELPNVTGMILFADKGHFASKPYCASGSYINKMSNYCKSCQYDVKQKVGDEACPFNYLYWDFLIRNQKKLADNPRLQLVYKKIKTMAQSQIKKIRQSAKAWMQS